MAPSKASDKTHTPPATVAKQAARGLESREKHGRGGTEVGVKRAHDLRDRKPLDAANLKKMHSYFARHNVDKRGKNWGDADKPSAGYIAWLLWGGEEGRAWVEGALKMSEGA